MTTFSLFEKDGPQDFRNIVIGLRKQSLEEGIDPVDFPEWLKKQGVSADAGWITIEDRLITFAALKRK